MRKTYVRGIITVLLAAAVAVLAVAPLARPQEAGAWMAALDDGRALNTLSIPGTHDAGAMYSFADVFGKCQTLSVPQQLRIGVRYFDLRLRLVDDVFRVYHDFVEQQQTLPQLLDALVGYLRENPSEFLIVCFKEELDPLRSEAVFSEALEHMLRQYPDVISPADTLPADVGAARGKLFVVARYDGATMGIPCYDGWVNNASFTLGELYVQDHYKISHTDEKLPDIEQTLAVAAAQQHGLVLNHTSCYFDHGYPPSYAGNPARTIEPWLRLYLKETTGTTGVLVCDFMTSALAEIIIRRNFS